jgi:hypothetical protein
VDEIQEPQSVIHWDSPWIFNLSAPGLELVRSLNCEEGPTGKRSFDSSRNVEVACGAASVRLNYWEEGVIEVESR